MHVDISRATFDAAKRFSGVITQQGRLVVDADTREEHQILLHYLRTVVADIVGPVAVPAGPDGFRIAWTDQHALDDLSVSPGRMYVGGILVENPSATTYYTQPSGSFDPEGPPLPSGPDVLVYLRVWERAVTAVEDPSIREIALGDPGPDTAARSQVVWQLAVHGFDEGVDNPTTAFFEWLLTQYTPRGRLRAQVTQPPAADLDVCSISPTSGYRGPENQLYRVEIHRGGTSADATFVWSRDNGSVVFPITHRAGAEVTVATLGRDGKQGLEVGDLVELVDDTSVFRAADDEPAIPPPLYRVVAVDGVGSLVTLGTQPGDATGTDPTRHPLLRRWDHQTTDDDATIAVVEGEWIPLEDGVEVWFERAPGQEVAHYRAGDYWLIPARTVSGDVLWPQDASGPAAVDPAGIDFRYAPLARLRAGGQVDDLRQKFSPLAT